MVPLRMISCASSDHSAEAHHVHDRVASSCAINAYFSWEAVMSSIFPAAAEGSDPESTPGRNSTKRDQLV
ncbi:hypothetical protein GCM10011314_00270 [Knoellia flava]|uniref:Uncharacterized protein n=1 Tax=Knoellia flava TaxID=913969 RepID=A0A8H9FQZ4_9MICO|nr:hypothetical protein GCM10011314_00270 [Knoellia flava]